MNTLIGSITGMVLLLLFRFFEKKRVKKLGYNIYIFLIYMLFCSYLLKPFEEFVLWIGLSLIFYSVLDDIVTKSLNIIMPVIATLLFLVIIEKPYFFIYSFIIFFIFLILTKLTKEKITGEGDVYVFMPLSFLLISKLEVVSVLTVANILINSLLLSVLFASMILIPLKLAKKTEADIAFTPFLVLGFALIYSGVSLIPWIFLGSFILCFLLYFIYMIVKLTHYLKNKKAV